MTSGDFQHFQHFSTLILYVLCFEIITTNSRTSTLWKLNSDQTKIIEASPFHQVVSYPPGGSNGAQFVTEDDPVFNIITSTVHFGQSWTKQRVEYYCTNCHTVKSLNSDKIFRNSSQSNLALHTGSTGTKLEPDEILDCGKPVNFTYYDNLVGVLNRNRHPNVPEPQAALIFGSGGGNGGKKTTTKNKNGGGSGATATTTASGSDFDVDALERKLKKAKREKPKSVQLYNQIGNFWRIKGDAKKAIECFRRALAVSPHNAEVLLNLARVLFTLQYLDDAIYLTRRSLEVQPPEKGAWQQYFTLGEILKAYGHYQEASVHMRHTLELKPGFEPAQTALKEMENTPTTSIHIYTLVIIICLVLGVLLVILSSVDNIPDNDYPGESVKPQRHFNKAMAMRSLRGLGISQNKHSRTKKMIA